MPTTFNFTQSPNYPHLNEYSVYKELEATTDWDEVSNDPNLSDAFIDQYKDKLNWTYLSARDFTGNQLYKYARYIKWDVVSRYSQIPLELISSQRLTVNWTYICRYQQNLPLDFISRFETYVDWDMVSKYQKLTEEFMTTHKLQINWILASEYQTYTEAFVRRNADVIDWYAVSGKPFTSAFFDEFKDRVTWSRIGNSREKALGREFIEEHLDYVDWNNVSRYEEFDMTNADDIEFISNNTSILATTKVGPLNWHYLCSHQTLTEEQIRENASLNDWSIVCTSQELSESLMDDFQDVIDWESASRYQTMSTFFVESHMEYLYKYMNNLSQQESLTAYIYRYHRVPVKASTFTVIQAETATENSYNVTLTNTPTGTGVYKYKLSSTKINSLYGDKIQTSDTSWVLMESGDTISIPEGQVLNVVFISIYTGIVTGVGQPPANLT